MTIDGPAWTAPGLHAGAGKYPLAVEQHVMAMASRLVPGVTTVTPHARYYAVHALVAAEAEERGLERGHAQDLVRRTEVMLAAVSFVHHGGQDSGLGRAHGTDALAGRLREGVLSLTEASVAGKGGYVQAKWGFSGAYFGSEMILGILNSKRAPGPACDVPVLRESLGELLELAAREEIDMDELADRGHLCICAGGNSRDGRWLAELLCGTDTRGPDRTATEDRRHTIQLIARIIDTHPVAHVTKDVGDVLAFGDFLAEDDITAQSPVAAAWRGLVLRNHAAGAWRRLWAWLVDEVPELTHMADVANALAARLPTGTVASFLDALPATTTPSGQPTDAERQLWGGYDAPECDLAILAVGARRVAELDGDSLDVFAGRRDQELTPAWFADLLVESRSSATKDFAARLTSILVARSERVALAKTRRRADGTLWFPARLRVLEGGWMYRVGEEGRGDVNLRLDRLGNVLAGAGVLAWRDNLCTVTDLGSELLG